MLFKAIILICIGFFIYHFAFGLGSAREYKRRQRELRDERRRHHDYTDYEEMK